MAGQLDRADPGHEAGGVTIHWAAGECRVTLGRWARSFGTRTSPRYTTPYAAMFDDAVLRTMVGLLAELAGEGPAPELAVGTGRVALPLSERGIPVSAIELSPHMADRLRAKPEPMPWQ